MRKKTSYGEDIQLIEKLIANWEDETVEFKEAGRDFDTDRLGRYVSALCNEANLAGMDSAWLVFGVRNKTREVVGTSYRTEPDRLNSLKRQVFEGCVPNFSLRGIHVVDHPKAAWSCSRFPQRHKVCPLLGRASTTRGQARASCPCQRRR